MDQESIAHYRIVSKIGEGGMGAVYRASDTKLGRDVAIKVLPDAFANDADRLARFTREAQVLASLNHPNIATIFGIEERAIVMELVEGPTLAERIEHGALPLDEALGIARQIAEALEAAHEKNVIHRDLKPANVKVTPEGTVKVLDFGLAKLTDPREASDNPQSAPTVAKGHSPTIAGMIMGTAEYMSPEQASGKLVDRRTDIWSFGVVLWEMLSGHRMFSGETVSHTLAGVLQTPIDFEHVIAPEPIRNLLRRCLDRDARSRLRDIGEARLAITKYLADPAGEVQAPQPARSGSKRGWAVAAILGLAAAVLAFVHFRESPPPERVLRYSMFAPEKSQIHTFALSPDGRYLAITAAGEGKRRLWIQPMDALAARELRGTEDAQYPFWSPDSRSIGFFGGGKLKRIDVEGGPTQTLCDAPDGRSGAWNQEGVIVFAPTNAGALQRVAASGGVPVAITKTATEEIHRFPIFLPDGRRFLYLSALGPAETNGVFLATLDGQPPRRILPDLTSVSWVPHPTTGGVGYLVFHRERTLMAQPFHTNTFQPAGELFPVAERISLINRNYALASVSSNGVLVYWSAGSLLRESQLTWYDRTGKTLGKVGAPAFAQDFSLSPDGKTVAVARSERDKAADLWLHDLTRDIDTRFTFDASGNRLAVWSPDSRRMAYSSFQGAVPKMLLKETSGTGQDEAVIKPDNRVRWPADWSSDGRTLLYFDAGLKGGDLWTLNMEGDRKPTPFLVTEFNETHGQFSPDGRWVAYSSNESGRNEIYVRPFPAGAGKWKVSVDGGELPRWRRDGQELYYLVSRRKLMAAAVKALPGPQPALSVGSTQPLFETRIPAPVGALPGYPYAVTADGKRFLVSTATGDAAEIPLTVVVNWLAGVKK